MIRGDTTARASADWAALIAGLRGTGEGTDYDRERVVALARHHGVIAHLAAASPGAVTPDDLHGHLLPTLQLVGELRRLIDLFASHQLPILPWKGPLLSISLYGDPARRSSRDLDLLIAPADFARASEVLQTAGYTPELPLTAAQQRAQIRTQHDFAFVHRSADLLVELHWAFAQRHYAFEVDVEGVWARARAIYALGRNVLQPDPVDQLLLLALHAAKHRWAQLDLLIDFSAGARQVQDFETLWRRAAEWKMHRILAVTTLVAGSLRLEEVPDGLESTARGDPAAQRVAAVVSGALAEGRALRPGIDLRVRDQAAQSIARVLRLAVTPTSNDWRVVRLPDSLYFLYYGVRQVRLAVNALRGVSAPA